MILCIPLGLARTDDLSGAMAVMTCKFYYIAKISAVDFVVSNCWLTYDDNFIWALLPPSFLS